MPIEALGFFMEGNFVKYRKGEFNGKREIFCPLWSFLQRAKPKQLAKYCGQDFGSFLPTLNLLKTNQQRLNDYCNLPVVLTFPK